MQKDLKVSALLIATRNWNWVVINQTLWTIDIDEVHKIPVGHREGQDILLCHYDPPREYTVKSG